MKFRRSFTFIWESLLQQEKWNIQKLVNVFFFQFMKDISIWWLISTTNIFFCFLKIMLLVFDNFIQYILIIFSPFPHLLRGSPDLHIHPTSSSFCYLTKWNKTKHGVQFVFVCYSWTWYSPRVWLVVRATSENTTRLASSASTSCE